MNDVNATQLAAAVRQIALALGGYAIGRGWLEEDTLTALVSIAAIAIPFAWGQFRTRKLAQK